MEQKKRINKKPTLDQATYEWLISATVPLHVDPRNIDTNILVWNACLSDLRNKINLIREPQ